MAKRKARDEVDDDDYNVLKPIDVSIFGTESDPCFGKHYDSAASECGRCGDSQICQIVCGQLQNVKRNKVEKQKAFKDKDTEVDNSFLNLKDISNSIIGLLEKRGDQKVSKLVRYIKSNFDSGDKFGSDNILDAIKTIVKDHPQMRSYKKENKRHVTWLKKKKKKKKS